MRAVLAVERLADVVDDHRMHPFGAVGLMNQVVAERGGGHVGNVFVFGDRLDFVHVEVAQAENVVLRDHGPSSRVSLVYGKFTTNRLGVIEYSQVTVRFCEEYQRGESFVSDHPVFVEALRGGHVESRHPIAFAIVDAEGRAVATRGDVERPVFPRSAIKVIQALPLVESGAADALGFTTAELALATASHNAEARHVEGARAMLAKVGRDETCLACGPQWPGREADRGRLHVEGRQPSRLHNNCSGKHAGFVCAACHQEMDPAGYERVDHPLHRQIAAALADVTGVDLSAMPRGTDGCSIPTWAIPLRALAHGFAKLTTGVGLAPTRAAAAARLLAAARAEPFMIAGTGRTCTELIEVFDGRIYVKIGAEGVYVASLPELGLAVALKCADGAARAAEVAIATLVAHLTGRADDPALAPFLSQTLRDWNGAEVGAVRAAEGWRAAITGG